MNVISFVVPTLDLRLGAIIAKLPQSWNGYRKKLLHRRDDITLEELQKHLRIKEDTKFRDSKSKNVDSSKVNVAEASKFSKNFKVNNDKKFKKPGNGQKKFSENCFFCGKKGHHQNDCRYKKKKEVNTNNANAVEEKSEDICAMVSELQIGMITETNMAASKSSDWWLDSSVTIHVCNDKTMFLSYKVEKEGQTVLMRSNDAAMVAGRGVVEINFTSEKKLTLNNVPDIRKNLVSASLMCKNGLKIVLEGNNCIVSKNGIFVGKGYSCDGMYKLNFYRMIDPKSSKLGARGIRSVFVGYAENSKAYRLLNLDSNVIMESRDVEFAENKFSLDSSIELESNVNRPYVDIPGTSTNKRKESMTSFEPRRSQRERKEKDLAPDFISSQALTFLVEGDRNGVFNKIPLLLNIEEDPKTFNEAMSSRDASFWREAVNDEMDSIISN
ncbi:Retrovirus-related Pol polyprotein from transposon TNT 1-94 [Morus notabilis]|uniref:Retrovirus-related Pol polyprotein from transposon TNT 1-94 n=1 Tax=Morus notabilis TaxID=981085 RepID=W9RII2_9ROSA|nr:Retrovirus-related Pol polyprotein from transposon TNT 1-94 [Morus notabilis]